MESGFDLHVLLEVSLLKWPSYYYNMKLLNHTVKLCFKRQVELDQLILHLIKYTFNSVK